MFGSPKIGSPEASRDNFAKKQGWRSQDNTISEERIRSADCYVFCLYEEQAVKNADVLDLDKWSFRVISTVKLNQVFGNQKTVSLNPLRRVSQAIKFDDLKPAIDLALAEEVNICP